MALFVSLFSGGGGLDLGLESSGWECRYASDIDRHAAATLESNRNLHLPGGITALSEAHVERADVRISTGTDILAKAAAQRGDIALLAGGPPCQSWSSAGHQQGFNDPRGLLFGDFVRLAGELDVRWLMFENVRGLLTARGPDGLPGTALSLIRARLLAAGFQTAVSLLNAADYGVPQRRVRLVVIGYRAGDAPPMPAASHAKDGADGLATWISLGDTLAGLTPPEEREIIRPSPALGAELAACRPGTGVRSAGKAESTRPGGHWGYKQGAFVADPALPARTVTASTAQDWVSAPGGGLRRLCPRECAALQTFPATWRFEGDRAAQYRQVGNAVPPLLAARIGTALLGHAAATPSDAHPADTSAPAPLPIALVKAVRNTEREEARNGESRRAAPARRMGKAPSGAGI